MKHAFRKAAFFGLALWFLAPFQAWAACDDGILFGGSVSIPTGDGGGVTISGSNCGGFGAPGSFLGGGLNFLGLPAAPIMTIVGNTVFWLLAILGFIAIIAFLVSGMMYLLSAGDDDMAERAKEALKNSIIGIIVALIGLIVFQAIRAWLSGATFF
jgi:uncharacterized membrane protein